MFQRSEMSVKMTVKVPAKLFISDHIRTNYLGFELFKNEKPRHFSVPGFYKRFYGYESNLICHIMNIIIGKIIGYI